MSEKKAKIVKKSAMQLKEEKEARRLALEKVKKMEEHRLGVEARHKKWEEEYKQEKGFSLDEYLEHLKNVRELNKQK